MKAMWALLAVVILIALTAAFITKGKSRKGAFGRRPIATGNEQAMFWRLTEGLPQPEYVVLAQVSFGALLTAKDGASRYSFSQKRADFVITDKSFKVLAVIELDDASHRGKEDKDAKRDAMLTEAGYKVLRYPRIPDAARIKMDMATPPENAGDERQRKEPTFTR